MYDLEEIRKQLESDDPEVIREGAYAAGESGYEELIPLLAGRLQSSNLGVQEAVDQALRRIGGPETVKAIVALLRSDEAPVRNLSMDILREIGREDFALLTKLLRDEDHDIRIFAADILGSTQNVMAVDPLCEALLKDPEVNVRYQAAVSLGDLECPEAASCLNKAMQDEEWVLFAVIEALTKIRAESSVNALIKALQTSTDLVASMIIDALAEMGNIKAVTVLLRRLDSSAAVLRNKIVKAIVRILGGKSLTLLSEHERDNFKSYALAALQDEDEEIQDAAMQGLSFVGGKRATAEIMKLAAELDPQRDQERLERIAYWLATIGYNESIEQAIRQNVWKMAMLAINVLRVRGKPDAVPLLIDVFWDKDLEIQRAIIAALNALAGAESRDFFVAVLNKHNDGDVLKGAAFVLGRKLKSEIDGERIFSLLEHPYNDVKEAALEACVSIGGQAMLQRFKRLFQSPKSIDRLMATFALGKLDLARSMDEIKVALEDEVPDIRKTAIQALADMGGNFDEELQLAVSRLHDENHEVRLAVVEILGGCGSPVVTKYLLQALGDTDDWVRIRAIEALGERGDREVISSLIPLLDTPNTLVALKVIDTLGKLGGHASFRSLLEVVNSDDPELQAAAEEAISRIQNEQGRS
jgi:HEAT repeat protein